MKTCFQIPAIRTMRVASLPILFSFAAAAEPLGVPLASPSAPASADAPLFTRLAPEQSGISHVPHMDIDHPMSYLYHSGMTCGGVAVGDFDGDGKPDLFFAGTNERQSSLPQTGDLKFEEVTRPAARDSTEATRGRRCAPPPMSMATAASTST